MASDTHLLIVGSGSVGKRHARNFAGLGCTISCVDPRVDRVDEMLNHSGVQIKAAFATLEQALDSDHYDAAVVCSPTYLHVPQASQCLSRGVPVLLEKPVAKDLAGARRLVDQQRPAGVPVLVGYTWRWWPPLQKLRTVLASGAVGALRHARFVMSANLADWHPWEPYQDFFMAKSEHGGGALLDESHWIDMACWLFGEPERICASIEKISSLEIDADDNVDLLLSYPEGMKVGIHLDLFGRPHEKTITVVGESGSIHWSAASNQVAVGTSESGWDQVEYFNCERNDMFVAIARHFLDVLAGAPPACSLSDGMRVMRVIEAARASQSGARTVALTDVAA